MNNTFSTLFSDLGKLFAIFGLWCLCAILFSGCTSIGKQLDSLPDGKATKMRTTIAGKFSTTTFNADNWEKTPEKATADKIHFRHSNPWVTLIEGEIEGYERIRRNGAKEK